MKYQLASNFRLLFFLQFYPFLLLHNGTPSYRFLSLLL